MTFDELDKILTALMKQFDSNSLRDLQITEQMLKEILVAVRRLNDEKKTLEKIIDELEEKIANFDDYEDERDDLRSQLDFIEHKGETIKFSKILCEEISIILELYLKQTYDIQPKCCATLHQEIFNQIISSMDNRLLDKYCGE